MDDILGGLNDQQKAAVTCPSNVLQVLAPPGSGKTKTLTARVAYHISHESLKPWNIIVCTFTIKAAREMKERIRSFVGEELEKKLLLGTFHSIARRYLSTYGHHIGVPKQFGISDSNDTLAILKRIVKKGGYSIEPNKARSRISKRKSGIAQTKAPGKRLDVEQQEFEAIFDAYEKELKDQKLLDYDDLLLRCVKLLTECPECVSNIEAVLIDEFQDTNHVQYELMNLFAQHRTSKYGGGPPKITIVGDPDQSIYSFRSAEIENLTRMQKKYPGTQVINLEENYRSSGSILRFATEVIEQDSARLQKNLQATHAVGSAPTFRTLTNASVEASWVVSEIRRSLHLNAGLLTYADYSILLRSASLSRLIETELGRAGIPYRMVGGHKFFDRVEVRVLLDYLRVINQPDQNDALLRVLNVPSRKIGDTTVQVLHREREARGKSLWFIIKSIARGSLKTSDKLGQQAITGLENFTNVVLCGQEKLAESQTTVGDMLSYVMQKLKYESFLRDTYKQEYEDRAANVDELVTLAQSGRVFAEQEEELIEIYGVEQQQSELHGPAEELTQFLAKISLATDADKQEATGDSNDKVVISTIHSAKGLEWPVVFIPAAYQGSIPHSRAEDTDEERRLLYVGMTRAKALLYLSWPKMSSKTEHTIMSPFLNTPTISRYYECKGPSFGPQVSSELARILGRDCPTSDAINQRFMSLGLEEAVGIRAEDDRHSEEVDRFDQESGTFGTGYTADELDRNYGSNFKKRKYNRYSVAAQAVAAPTNAGFTTARVHADTHPVLEEPKYKGEIIEPEVTAQKRAKSQDVKPKKAMTGQQSINTFFASKTQSTLKPEAINTLAQKEVMRSSNKPATLLLQMSTTHMSAASPSLTPVPRHMPPIPGASRSVSTQRSFQRPQLEHDEPNQDRPKHVLLSSSPTKPDVCSEPTEVAQDAEDEKENPGDGNISVPGSFSGFQTLSTMHTTSMQKLNGLQNRPGVRMKLGGRATGGRATGGYVNTQYRPPSMK